MSPSSPTDPPVTSLVLSRRSGSSTDEEAVTVLGGHLTTVEGRYGVSASAPLGVTARGGNGQVQVSVDGTVVDGADAASAAGIRYIPTGNGLAHGLTALENVLAPLLPGMSYAEARDRALAALTAVGLDEVDDHLIEELSGGQQQRTAIARALASRARVLLADEPTSELDRVNRDIVVQLLTEHAATGAVVLVVTDDPDIATLPGAHQLSARDIEGFHVRAGRSHRR